MTIEIVDVTNDDVAKAIRIDEGHFADVKATAVSPGKLTKTLAAFANADGGELFVGIAEGQDRQPPHRWEGFESVEAANGHIQALESVFPLSGEHRYEFLRSASSSYPGLVLHIEIDKSSSIKKASDGKIYKRRGAQNLPLTSQDEIEVLKRTKGISSFETETISYPVEFLTNSEAVITFLIDLIPTVDPEAWLKKQLLIRAGLPTVAAVLLFSDEPQTALPKRSGIKVYRYQTTKLEGTRETLAFDPITIEGCLYSQIYATIDKVIDIVQESKAVKVSGMSAVVYPREAIHEIITNAVIHRDYGIADDIHIRIFDNRIEIESPGRLPAHITPSNIL
ncbi:RNA-binding domain-containing protein, partial [Nocardia veterana]